MAKKTAAQLAAYAKSMIGHPYWFGTFGQAASTSLLGSKAKQYPGQYPASMAAQRKREAASGVTVTDCYGLAKGFCWMDDNGLIKYASNGVPDMSADDVFASAKDKGEIKTIPEIPGVCVRYKGHFGVYIGGGYVVEARGRSYGVVKTKLGSRPWTHWFKLPYIDYSGVETTDTPAQTTSRPTIKKGSTGANVKTMQTILMAYGYDLPVYGADGDFGSETDKAVKTYQKDKALEVDGIVGVKTWAALLDVSDAAKGKYVHVSGGDYYIRAQPVNGEVVGVSHKGDTLPYLGVTSPEGWYYVQKDGVKGYISGTGSKLV